MRQRCSPNQTKKYRVDGTERLENGIFLEKGTNRPRAYLFTDESLAIDYYDDAAVRHMRIPAD